MSLRVEAVENARDVMRNLKKEEDAPWVAGLTPFDGIWAEKEKERLKEMALARVALEIATAERQREIDLAKVAMEVAAAEDVACNSHTLLSPWLRGPLLLILLSVMLSAVMGSLVPASVPRLVYPQSELVLWDIVKYGSGGRAHSVGTFPMVRPVLTDVDMSGSTLLGLVIGSEVPYILGTLLLCLRLGRSTSSFAALCGVGCALLAIGAQIIDVLLFLRACNSVDESECDYPFISHWATVVFRRMGPTAAIALASMALGLVTTGAQAVRDAKSAAKADTRGAVAKAISSATTFVSKYQWALFSAIPFVGYTIYFSLCAYLQRSLANGVVLVGGIEQLVVLATVGRLWMQPPLRTVVVRPHLD